MYQNLLFLRFFDRCYVRFGEGVDGCAEQFASRTPPGHLASVFVFLAELKSGQTTGTEEKVSIEVYGKS